MKASEMYEVGLGNAIEPMVSYGATILMMATLLRLSSSS